MKVMKFMKFMKFNNKIKGYFHFGAWNLINLMYWVIVNIIVIGIVAKYGVDLQYSQILIGLLVSLFFILLKIV